MQPYPGFYFTGDGAARDKDGYIWIKGRVDDVINVSGHRLSTAEIESALITHPGVAETAGKSSRSNGLRRRADISSSYRDRRRLNSSMRPRLRHTQTVRIDIPCCLLSAYEFLRSEFRYDTSNPQVLEKELVLQVRKVIGPFAAPKKIYLVGDLPKTRSGKIMRRVVRKLAAGEADQLGDLSTLADPSVVEELIAKVGSSK